MQAIVIDFTRQSPETFADVPELEAAHPHITTRPSAQNSSSTPSSPSSDSCSSGGKSLRIKML
jgi:hypothetical protein